MDKIKMIDEIIDFVDINRESTATRSIYNRILGRSNAERVSVNSLKNKIKHASEEEIASCYDLIK